ncbi:hypothetical protein DFP73DRAFT_77678 [Morchella snyderi]|nr:hypothetical protein DFP73DRAFT_77678 [Morchella snyderi]
MVNMCSQYRIPSTICDHIFTFFFIAFCYSFLLSFFFFFTLSSQISHRLWARSRPSDGINFLPLSFFLIFCSSAGAQQRVETDHD